MAEALVSTLVGQLHSNAFQLLLEEVKLVKDVDEDVRELKSNLEDIQAVLEDAERRQLADQSVRNWLDRLKAVSFHMDNVLDEWSTAILKLEIEKNGEQVPVRKNKKVRFSIRSPFSFFKSKFNRISLRHDIAHKIKDLNKKLESIAGEKDRFRLDMITREQPVERPKTTSFINETEIHGRDKEKEILVSKLVCENSSDHLDKRLGIIPIVGMGGMGKTTLAQLVYNDEKVKAHFDNQIWVCVSNPFEETKVAKAIVESIEGKNPNINELETLLQHIFKHIQGKRFLLILDDVWTENRQKWEPLKQTFNSGAAGSRIIVTTRKREVAIMMGAVPDHMITLEKLSEEHCWSIFKQLAFLERKEEDCNQLEEIGHKISRKAKGLPLVAKTLGSLMCFKKTKTQWEDVLDSDFWQSKDVKQIFTPFLLSYFDLSATEKRCFLYCSIFPKDHCFKRDQLIEMWMSQGYLKYGLNSEKEGHECFETLAMRSFFQNFEIRSHDGSISQCKMHDIVHDFAQFLTKDECITMGPDTIVEDSYLKPFDERTRHLTVVVGSNSQIPTVKYNKVLDETAIRTLFVVPNANNGGFAATLFSSLRFLRTLTLSQCGITSLPESIGQLIHLRYLDLTENRELVELPDALCSLCNLQTLHLNFCNSLRRLPEGIGKLVNLKHLHITYCVMLEGLPKGIGTLTRLRRLSMLVIPKDKETYLDIGDVIKLKSLQLTDSLHIKDCRNIKNASEVVKIDLKNKEKVFALNIDFGWLGELNSGVEDDIAVLEALEPHQNLARLMISNYMGTSLSPRPRWMLSLINLRQLHLYNCQNCEIIPSFGELPSLEVLNLIGMMSVKKVGVEFLGITEKKDKEDSAANREASLNSPTISFLKLEKLSFNLMLQLEKWEGTTTSTESTSLMIMPSLQRLEFEDCPRLQALPDFLLTKTTLKYLSISESAIVEDYCQKRIGKEWDKISHVPNITVNGKFVQKDGVWIHKDDVNNVIGTSSSPK